MSFSSDLKEELSKISNLNKKDEVKYELIGYLISKNATVVKNSVRYATGSEYNINRFSKLLRNLNIDNDIEFDGKSFIITFKIKNLIDDVEVIDNQLNIKDYNLGTQSANFENENYRERDLKIDKILTSKTFGIPIMILFLGIIFWITIVGANYPSEFLFNVFNWFQDKLVYFANYIHSPAWLSDMLINGVYKTLTWIIAVMLPPMAIFFPLFTILEDLGYLPRIAFNMDGFFKKACCSGKQMITMCMGVTKWYFFYLSNIYVTQILYLPEFIRHIYIN